MDSSKSFFNNPRSISGSAAKKPTGVVKKVRVVNNGSDIKKMSAIVNAANKSAASYNAQSVSSSKTVLQEHPTPTPRGSFKKVELDSADASIEADAPSSAATRSTSVKPTKKPIGQKKAPENTNASPLRAGSPTRPAKAITRNWIQLKTGPAEAEDDFDLSTTKRETLQPKAKKSDKESKLRKYAAGHAQHPLNSPNISSTAKPVALPSTTPSRRNPEVQKAAPNLAQSLSLQRMKDSALVTLGQRRKSLQSAYAAIAPLKAGNPAVEEAMGVLRKQIEALDTDIAKLQVLGRGFETSTIKGIDPEALVALASWGLSVEEHFAPKNSVESVGVAETQSPVEDTSLDEAIMAALFGDEDEQSPPVTDGDNTPLQPDTHGSELTKPPPPAPPPSLPKKRTTISMFSNYKPRNAPVSRAPQPIGTLDHSKAATTSLIDPFEAHQAELLSTAAQKKQKSNKSAAGYHAKKDAGAGTKSRFFRDKDGNVGLRKGKASACAGEKRKRGDMLEQPGKRSAVEGRGFGPVRVRARHAIPTWDAMQDDSPTALLTLKSLFTL